MLTKSVFIALSNGYGLEPAVLLCINRGEGKVNMVSRDYGWSTKSVLLPFYHL